MPRRRTTIRRPSRRGLFRTEYAGRTLRDHLGLPRPENQFTAQAAQVAQTA